MNEQIKQAVEQYFRGLLTVLGETAEIQYKKEGENELFINLQGVSTFDGLDAKLLRALSYLAEIAMRRRLGTGIRIHLDINNQWAKRLAEIQQLARRLADEAVRESKKIQLDPMETYERKAIHEALSGFEGVRTYSEGRGAERRVVIEPVRPSGS